MELFVVDAFTDQFLGGNQAGVILLGQNNGFPEPTVMQKIAAELKHSETAFVKAIGNNTFKIRFFTPEGEVNLCGHATISVFTVLRDEKGLHAGNYVASTLAGNLIITVEQDLIWMEMAKGTLLKQLSSAESSEVYHAYGLCLQDQPDNISACIVNTGLSDLLLPVNSKEKLDHATQNRAEVIHISKKHDVVGVHIFFYAPTEEITAECRNFAPLYGIDEEAATGTSNGALTYLLFSRGFIHQDNENVFMQGTGMGRPSTIRSKIQGDHTIFIGGNAVISIKGCLML